MLQALFNSRNVERILLFLFVNEKCYGTQIQSLLQVPLTPVQKALMRLEKSGVICSHYEGKTRLYQFSPSYPLRGELEALLKKVYTLLPPQEKRLYCFVHKPRLQLSEERQRERNRKQELLTFWEKLKNVQRLSFSVKTRHGEEETMKLGKAEVAVSSSDSLMLIFEERGNWFIDEQPDTAFSNRFRWTLDLDAALVTLEHLRYGESHPVFLFHFTPTRPFLLEPVDAHLCAEDTYLGNISWNRASIDLQWRVIGPKKNHHLVYHYC